MLDGHTILCHNPAQIPTNKNYLLRSIFPESAIMQIPPEREETRRLDRGLPSTTKQVV